MRCIKCKRFVKENTQGNERYCQGHTIWDRPEDRKQYRLTGAPGIPCIFNGNTWAESLVK